MLNLDAERFLDNLPVEMPSGEEVTLDGERVTADHKNIILPDGEIVSNHVEGKSVMGD